MATRWVLDGSGAGGTMAAAQEGGFLSVPAGAVTATPTTGALHYDDEGERLTIRKEAWCELVDSSPVAEMVVDGSETRRDIVPTASSINHFFVSGGRHGQQFHIYLAPPPQPCTMAEVRFFNSSTNGFMTHVNSARGDDIATFLGGHSGIDFRWFKDRYIISQSWAYYE